MNLYRVYPEPGQIDLSGHTAQELLDQWFQPAAATRMRWALVATPGGDVHDANGVSTGLSNPTDRAILRTLRGQADAVITAASTVRSEPVPVPARATLVIVSSRGELSGQRVPAGSLREESVLILTGADPVADPASFFPPGVARHVCLPSAGSIDARAVLATLSQLGHNQLLLEAGAGLATPFMDAGVIDECVLTLTGSPRIDNHPPLPWWQDRWGQWSASAVFLDDQRYLYTRYHPPAKPSR